MEYRSFFYGIWKQFEVVNIKAATGTPTLERQELWLDVIEFIEMDILFDFKSVFTFCQLFDPQNSYFILFYIAIYFKYRWALKLSAYINAALRSYMRSYEFIYKYTIEIFFNLSLFRLRNVCRISISINRLFEPTYWMYEPLISILKHVMKILCKNSCGFENKHFSCFKSWQAGCQLLAKLLSVSGHPNIFCHGLTVCLVPLGQVLKMTSLVKEYSVASFLMPLWLR